MIRFFVVVAEYDYPVAVQEYQLRGRKVLHSFMAKDFLEAVEIKNKWAKESDFCVRLAQKKARAERKPSSASEES
ncbi:hypothetical protein [Ruminococcus sp.]|uniref:hypothetical protein n=1 Tax=Ruminococcus sp. TaxID=41978 RepID=UPI003866465D